MRNVFIAAVFLILVIFGIPAGAQICPRGDATMPAGTSAPSTLASDGSQFALIADDDRLYTSPDGTTWTERYSDSGLRFAYNMEWTGREFMVVAGAGVLMSTDGITWTDETVDEDAIPQDFAWDGSQTILVGSGQFENMYARPDGGSWGPVDYGSAERLRTILWTGDQFIAGGNSGYLITSPDGLNWTEQDIGSGVAVGETATDGTLVIATTGSTPRLTLDGVNWAEGAFPGVSLGTLDFQNGQFVAGGINFDTDQAGVSVSQDGFIWRQQDVGIAESKVIELASNGTTTLGVTQRNFQTGPPNQLVELEECQDYVFFKNGFEE